MCEPFPFEGALIRAAARQIAVAIIAVIACVLMLVVIMCKRSRWVLLCPCW